MTAAPLVSVVVPAFNAQRTLARTLQSALDQSHRELEVLVVDDGSRDRTAELAQQFAERDARVRVIRQANGGVSRARNRGIREARGEYLAPLDADDLWHSTKLEKQVATLEASTASTAFVYCACRTIDEQDHVLGNARAFRLRGRVLHRHALVNFVGNGSALLLRRAPVLEIGGYDPDLRDAGYHGAEDFLLQLRLASRYEVEVVPEYLVGYRRSVTSASEANENMALSFLAAQQKLLEHCTLDRRALNWGAGPYLATCAVRAAWRGQLVPAACVLGLALRRDVAGTVAQVAAIAGERTRFGRLLTRGALAFAAAAPLREPAAPRKFFDHAPDEGIVERSYWLLERRLAKLERLDLG